MVKSTESLKTYTFVHLEKKKKAVVTWFLWIDQWVVLGHMTDSKH